MWQENYKIIMSHLYDIYSVLSGTIVFIIVYLAKPYIKSANATAVYGKGGKRPDGEDGKALRIRYRRRNAVLFPLIMLLGIFVYWACTLVTSQIRFRWGAALMSGPVAVAEYAISRQIIGGKTIEDESAEEVSEREGRNGAGV